MARKTIAQLSASFKTGDTPQGTDFENIFDSNLNLQETGTSVASGSLNVLTDVTASKFKGDGSALTNLPASSTFPSPAPPPAATGPGPGEWLRDNHSS